MKLALYVAALALSLASSAALRAQPVMQPFYPGFAGLPPYEIVTIVRSAGLDSVSRPVRQGPVYLLRALTPAGQEVRVVVDARMGRIVKVAAVAPCMGTVKRERGRAARDPAHPRGRCER